MHSVYLATGLSMVFYDTDAANPDSLQFTSGNCTTRCHGSLWFTPQRMKGWRATDPRTTLALLTLVKKELRTTAKATTTRENNDLIG